ncbi:uncharacterized protein LOC143635130 [Bidens hawaiensis]|uniref:uncharacterized protein LOC143635130 n=1 Tax=Bidens hawaiensis TaxID=980011 RepID=UPI00404B5883
MASENPYSHLTDFLAICESIGDGTYDQDGVRLRLFQFSLKDKAKNWFNSLPMHSMGNWAEMHRLFINEYYSQSKTSEARMEIRNFHSYRVSCFTKHSSEAAAERRRRGTSSRSVKSVTSESEQIAELERELAGLRKGKKKEVGNVGVKFPVCDDCGELGHKAENCPEFYDEEEDDTEEVNYAYGVSKGQGMNSNTYHPGLRNHPNFRYGNASS